MGELASKSPVGSNKLIFNPTLAMGGPLDSSINTKGAFIGLDLKHERKDLIRAAMEGIAMSLCLNLNELKKRHVISGDMLFVGGGSNSDLWRQIFADVYQMNIQKTDVGQNAGALGAAAIAAVGAGLWENFDRIDTLHSTQSLLQPNPESASKYEKLMEVFKVVAQYQAEIGDRLANLV
jgi:xylulokinase